MRLILALLLTTSAYAADTCLVVQRSEPLTGIATWSTVAKHNWRPFMYVSGEFPAGMKFKSGLKDNDITDVKAKGGKVIVLDTKYTHDDLDAAKKECGEK